MKLRTYNFKAMGGPCELRLYGRSRPELDRVAELAQGEVRRIERKYSRYRDDSVTAEINRSAGDKKGVRVDSETAQLLNYAEICYQQSEGLFDITSGVLRTVWDFKSGKLPTPAAVSDALQRRWLAARSTGSRRSSFCRLPVWSSTLAATGRSTPWTEWRISARSTRSSHGLVDLGGDLAVIGPHPDGVRLAESEFETRAIPRRRCASVSALAPEPSRAAATTSAS